MEWNLLGKRLKDPKISLMTNKFFLKRKLPNSTQHIPTKILYTRKGLNIDSLGNMNNSDTSSRQDYIVIFLINLLCLVFFELDTIHLLGPDITYIDSQLNIK